jgi:hypothetical protein
VKNSLALAVAQFYDPASDDYALMHG